VDATGAPFIVATATATTTLPAKGPTTSDVAIGPGGAFMIIVTGWAGDAPATLTLAVDGVVSQVKDPASACDQRVAWRATSSWTLPAGGDAPRDRTIRAERIVLSQVCGTTGTSAPTLPPTDADAVAPTPRSDGSGAGVPLALLLLATFVATVAVSARRGLSRRGS